MERLRSVKGGLVTLRCRLQSAPSAVSTFGPKMARTAVFFHMSFVFFGRGGGGGFVLRIFPYLTNSSLRANTSIATAASAQFIVIAPGLTVIIKSPCSLCKSYFSRHRQSGRMYFFHPARKVGSRSMKVG
jgi:hypothetical protein